MRGLLVLFLVLPSLAFADNGTSTGIPADSGVKPGAAHQIDSTPFGAAWGTGDLEWALPSAPGFAETFCDVVIDPDPKSGTSTPRTRPGMSVCILPGSFDGGLTFDVHGVRVVALEPGTVLVKGDVVLSAPGVLVGLGIQGNLLISAGARGSVLIGNSIQGAAVSETTTLMLAGNKVAGNGEVKALGRGLKPGFHVPTSAAALHVKVVHGSMKLDPRSTGDAVGWVTYDSLVHVALGATGGIIKPSTTLTDGMPAAKAGGVWTPLAPQNAELMSRLDNWMPVYGQMAKQDEAAVIVPLEVGPWGPHTQGMVVSTQ
jgi:hypothetical protein